MSLKGDSGISWKPKIENPSIVREPRSDDVDNQSIERMSDEELRMLNAEMRVNMKHPPKKEYVDDRTAARLQPRR